MARGRLWRNRSAFQSTSYVSREPQPGDGRCCHHQTHWIVLDQGTYMAEKYPMLCTDTTYPFFFVGKIVAYGEHWVISKVLLSMKRFLSAWTDRLHQGNSACYGTSHVHGNFLTGLSSIFHAWRDGTSTSNATNPCILLAFSWSTVLAQRKINRR